MNRKMGCLESPMDLRDYRVAKVVKTKIELPQEFELEPTAIKDQGSVGSCVAHAISSMLEKDGKSYSTGWIYGYRPDEYYQGQGMYPREALKTIKNLGAVKYKNFPYNIEMQQAKAMVDNRLETLKEYAQEKQILSYARLYSAQEIKEFLYQTKLPIPFAITTYNYLELDEHDIILLPDRDAVATGSHMMLIIGWNELGFIIQNSWGTDWGDNGLALLPYDYYINEAWGVTVEEEPIIVKPDFYWIRRIIQIIINFIKNGLK